MYTNSGKIVGAKVQDVPDKIDSIVQVVPDRIFSVAFHPGGEKLVAGAGDKWGKVGRGSAKIFFCIRSRFCHMCICSHFMPYLGLSFYAS